MSLTMYRFQVSHDKTLLNAERTFEEALRAAARVLEREAKFPNGIRVVQIYDSMAHYGKPNLWDVNKDHYIDVGVKRREPDVSGTVTASEINTAFADNLKPLDDRAQVERDDHEREIAEEAGQYDPSVGLGRGGTDWE